MCEKDFQASWINSVVDCCPSPATPSQTTAPWVPPLLFPQSTENWVRCLASPSLSTGVVYSCTSLFMSLFFLIVLHQEEKKKRLIISKLCIFLLSKSQFQLLQHISCWRFLRAQEPVVSGKEYIPGTFSPWIPTWENEEKSRFET